MDFKYIKNIKGGIGEIRIYDKIGVSVKNGKEVGISGSGFAAEMAHLKSVCNKINIHINSEGGSVLDGYAIYSSIRNCEVETESFIDGIAASTAGWCALAADKCNIADHASLMVHGASGGDDPDMVALANGSIAKMLSNRTGMTEDEANGLMKTETWYKAFDKKDRETLINKKLVDHIINTGKKVSLPKVNNASEFAQIYNKAINGNMSKLNTLLKLRNDAEESEQENAIVNLNKELADKATEVDSLKNKIKTLEEENTKREEAAKTALKAKATELVNGLKAKGLVDEKDVETTILNASKDEASFQFISNIYAKVAPGKTATKVFDVKNVKAEGGEDRSSWSYNDWEKKDNDGLIKMYNEDRDSFTAIYNKTFKK